MLGIHTANMMKFRIVRVWLKNMTTSRTDNILQNITSLRTIDSILQNVTSTTAMSLLGNETNILQNVTSTTAMSLLGNETNNLPEDSLLLTTAVHDNPGRLSNYGYLATGIYLTFLGLFAFFGNIMMLVVLYKGNTHFTRFHTMMLTNIAICDIGVACTAYPYTAISGYFRKWIFNDEICVVAGFTTYTFCTSDMNTLAVIAFSRYVTVCKKEWGHLIRGSNNKWFLIGIWVYTLFWTGTPLVGWSNYTYEPFGTSCTLNWFGKRMVDLTYNSLCCFFCFGIHVIIFVFCYVKISRCYDKLLKYEEPRIRTVSLGDIQMVERVQRAKEILSTRHMTKLCIMMVVAFCVAWTPYTAMTIWNIIETPPFLELQVLPTMFAKVSCATHPILYGLLCKPFRKALRDVYQSFKNGRRFTNRVSPYETQNDGDPFGNLMM